MKNATLIKMTALAGGLLLAVLLLNKRTAPADSALSQDALLVPELSSQLNDVSGISLTGASDTPIITLKRGEKGWVAESINGYGADIDKIRDYLLKLSQSKVREAKTANPDMYGKLGVEELKRADAKGIQIELLGLKKPVKIIMGSTAGQGGEGVYVRRPEDKQSYLASGQIRPEASVNSWIQADIVNIPASRIKSVSVTSNAGVVTVQKNVAEDTDWAVQDVPKGKTLSSPSIGNALAGTLETLRLESVLPAAQAEAGAETFKSRFLSFEGIQIDVVAWESAGKGYSQYSASLDPAQVKLYLDAETAKAQSQAAADAAVAASPAPSTAPNAQAPAAPASEPTPKAEGATDTKVALAASDAKAAFDAEAFRAKKMAELESQVSEINARTSGWSYVLPPYKFANLKKTMADMYASDAAPAATPGNPLNLSIPN